MSTTIWKFPLQTVSHFSIDLPFNYRIFDIQLQDDIPTLWAGVDDSHSITTLFLRCIATGEWIGSRDDLTYLKTIQKSNGFVWHFFKVGL